VTLDVRDDLLVDEIIFAAVFELTHYGGRYITRGEDGYFRGGALFDGSHWCFGRHVTKEPKWAGNETKVLGLPDELNGERRVAQGERWIR